MSASTEPPYPKRQRMMKKLIGTHSGTFHCDEALAVFLLRQTEAYKTADLVRTRDAAILDGCDIVVDVGAVYDVARQRFDHHQRGFNEILGYGFETKLSSAGLIFKHFGIDIIANRLKLPANEGRAKYLWMKLYRDFIEAIDAIDNGISQYPTDLQPRYRVKTDLSSRVATFNPRWNESADSEALDARFEQASALAGKEFMEHLDYYIESWLPARDLVMELITLSKQTIDPSGKILLFEKYVPWKEHLFELEEDQGVSWLNPGQATYVVYPDDFGGSWRVQAVPISPQSFENRKPLPDAWRGVRDDALSQLTGIDGCIFVHASGFIGGRSIHLLQNDIFNFTLTGNKTKDGALEMAKRALAM